MKNTAQLNQNVRSLYDSIIKKNIVYNPQYNLEQFPELYQNPKNFQRMIGGTRLQQTVTPGNDAHFPSIEQVEDNDSGGFYGRTRYSHPISGGMRKPSRSSIGILKQLFLLDPEIEGVPNFPSSLMRTPYRNSTGIIPIESVT